MKGYAGKVLYVNLTTSNVYIKQYSESFYRKYVGGGCMAAYWLLKMMEPGADPLGPDNILVFSVGPLAGISVSGSSRVCVSAKSPLTGGFATSEAGGYWGAELRFAGLDAVVINGKAPKPVYLAISNDSYEIKDATGIWGRLTGESQDMIRDILQEPRARVAQIGPAGERQVLFAAITNDLKHFNGRSGLGAVMGSKNLKAIAVKGSEKPQVHDWEVLREIGKTGAERVSGGSQWANFKRYGTLGNVRGSAQIEGLPTCNWTRGLIDGWESLSAEEFAETMMDKPGTCWGCVQSCKRDISRKKAEYLGVESRYGGPEYETIGMLGSNCGITDLPAIVRANEIANKYCVDSISLGGVIGFVMECFERGILTKNDIGFNAGFGDTNAMIKLCEMTVTRKGLGDKMAQGTARLAKYLGPEAEKICVTVKKREFPAHMPTSKGSLALAYAVSPVGPDHTASSHDACLNGPSDRMMPLGFYKPTAELDMLNFEKVKLMVYSQRFVSGIDALAVCLFTFSNWTIYDENDLLNAVRAATGWNYSLWELMLLGERRLNMMRLFNQREGFSEKDDILPERLFSDGLAHSGRKKGQTVDKEEFLKRRIEYYEMNGWDRNTGEPSSVKLRELGLGWILGDDDQTDGKSSDFRNKLSLMIGG